MVSSECSLQKSEAGCDSALGKLSVGISSSDETGSVSLRSSCLDRGLTGFVKLEVPQQLLCRGFLSSALKRAVCVSALVVPRYGCLQLSEAGSSPAISVQRI